VTTDTPPIELETAASPDAAVIWLHGLGADGSDFVPIVPELQLPAGARIRFVFPHAPFRPVTLNGGYVMRAWYDLYSLQRGGRQDRTGLAEASASLEDLIARECQRGIARERIVLAGFSQGGAVALATGLRQPAALAGIVGLSTYLPFAEQLADDHHPASLASPIFMAHGHDDPVIAFAIAEHARERLLGLGYELEWHAYAMQHGVCPAELRDLAQWLTRRLPIID